VIIIAVTLYFVFRNKPESFTPPKFIYVKALSSVAEETRLFHHGGVPLKRWKIGDYYYFATFEKNLQWYPSLNNLLRSLESNGQLEFITSSEYNAKIASVSRRHNYVKPTHISRLIPKMSGHIYKATSNEWKQHSGNW